MNTSCVLVASLLIVFALGIAIYGLFGPRKPEKPPERKPFQNEPPKGDTDLHSKSDWE